MYVFMCVFAYKQEQMGKITGAGTAWDPVDCALPQDQIPDLSYFFWLVHTIVDLFFVSTLNFDSGLCNSFNM